MSLILQGSTSGSVTLQEPAVAGTTVLTLPTTSGTVLTSASSVTRSQLPVGSVLQVVQTVKTSVFTTSSAMPTFVDITGLSATITPTSASSQVLVTVTGVMGMTPNGYAMAVNLVRTSTSIAIGDSRGSTTRCFAGGTSNTADARSFTVCFLDSPPPSSSTTYKVQLGAESGGTAIIGGCSDSSQAYHFSTPTIITLQEIAA